MRQLSRAVSFIHSKGIVHRDLKLENILVTFIDFKTQDIGVVIADFGLSKMIQNQNTQTPCGTFAYAAPELLSEKLYSQEVDIWSMGCLLFTLLVAYPPFYEDDRGSISDKIKEGFFEFLSPFWDSITDNAKDLISQLLRVNPSQRLRANQIEYHPWFSDKIWNIYPDKIVKPLWSPIPSVLQTPLDYKTKSYFQKSGTPTLRAAMNAPIDQYASSMDEIYTASKEMINLNLTDSSLLKKRDLKK
jgi:serine/threonine protein kinase